MNIQKINFVQYRQYQNNNNKYKQKEHNNQTLSYNPIAYRDFNISFGERLFRTPENFYEQEFNRENMPDTMASYLFADYEDRKHIPPAQMMKIVFNDLNNAKTVEEVKELFPNEELFANLHPMDNKKYREGILAEIRLLKEPDKSLFKNGKDDLGLYILKKIYLEGKTLKEINKDFKKDVSVVYAGISDINYRDLANLGIKYPKGPFWHSFYPTREDFPYVSVKRKDAEFHANGSNKKELTLADINRGDIEDKKPPKYKPKDHEIKDITGAILEDFGDKEKTNRNLKRKLRTDDPKLTFIQKYMGEIMSISLDRVHASDEMRAFFEDSQNIDKSAQSRMKKYWDASPEMKALQGLVMSDTIRLFFEYYGADGNNEMFKDLIDYAHSIKPEREERQKAHAEKQKYYDEIGEQLASQEAAKMQESQEIPDKNTDIKPTDTITPIFEEKNFKDKLVFDIDGKTYNIYSNLNEELTKCVDINFKHLLPSTYIDKYAKYLCKTNLADDIFKLSIIANNSSTDYSIVDSILYDKEKLEKETDKINFSFMKRFPIESRAAHQAFVDTMCEYIPESKDGLAGFIYKALPLDIPVVAQELQYKLTDSDKFMTERYNKYLAPVNNKESKEIANIICKKIMPGYNKDKAISFREYSSDRIYLEAFAKLFEGDIGADQKELRNLLQMYITKEYGGSARAILDDNLPQITKLALSEQILRGCLAQNENTFSKAISNNEKAKSFIFRERVIH